MKLTVIILTHNSEVTIKESLTSALFADEIIIIDDYSTDKTTDIIEYIAVKHHNLSIHNHYLHNNFAAQRNWALEKAKGEWVLFLDADEIISKDLQREIVEVLSSNRNKKINGYYLKRTDYLFTKKLHFGETSQIKLLRLARKGAGSWNYNVHEEWTVNGKIRELKQTLVHKRSTNISEFLQKINWYTTIRAKELHRYHVHEPLWKIFVYPIAKFCLNYFAKLGFLDGISGLAIAWLMSWHSLLVRIKLQLLWLLESTHKPKSMSH